jgi:hypothetical protein
MPGFDEAPVELDTGHRRHMDISDQAGGFDETRGREEIGGRRESLDGVAQRPHEPSHGLAKELIIINDQDQWRFRHTASGSSYDAPTMSSRAHASPTTCAKECRRGNTRRRKLWLMLGREFGTLRARNAAEQCRFA